MLELNFIQNNKVIEQNSSRINPELKSISNYMESENEFKNTFYRGTLGFMFTVIALIFIKYTKKRLNELYNHKNVSLNILNVWIYKTMILALIIQMIINIYSTTLFVSTSTSWLKTNMWFSLGLNGSLRVVRILFTDLFMCL